MRSDTIKILIGDSPAEKPALIYHHIPKCGGTTVRQAIKRNVDFNKMLKYHTYIWGNTAENVKHTYGMNKDYVKALHGHFVYKHYESFLNDDIYDFFQTTLVRNPISKVVSTYYYIKEDPKFKGLELRKLCEHISLKQFVDVNPKLHGGAYEHTHNYTLKWFTGDRESINKGKEMLDKFDVVGTLDDLEGFINLIGKKRGWQEMKETYDTHNRTKSKPSMDEITDEIKEKIAENNQKDMELYEYAKEKFNEELEG